MTRQDFIDAVTGLVGEFIFEGGNKEAASQLRVNPESKEIALESEADFLSEIADNDEAVEDAAAADNAQEDEATDWQVKQNPDFYPVSTLIRANAKGEMEVDKRAVSRLADKYTF